MLYKKKKKSKNIHDWNIFDVFKQNLSFKLIILGKIKQ